MPLVSTGGSTAAWSCSLAVMSGPLPVPGPNGYTSEASLVNIPEPYGDSRLLRGDVASPSRMRFQPSLGQELTKPIRRIVRYRNRTQKCTNFVRDPRWSSIPADCFARLGSQAFSPCSTGGRPNSEDSFHFGAARFGLIDRRIARRGNIESAPVILANASSRAERALREGRTPEAVGIGPRSG
jgi:hypothetical protein